MADKIQNGLLVRPAGNEDLLHLVALLKVLFDLEKDFIFNPDQQKKGLEMMLANDSMRRIWVADFNGRVVGMCSVQLVVSTAEGGIAGLLEDMVVAPEFHQKGIGRKLLRSACDWTRKKGASRLQLLADKTNRGALDFYAKLDWRPTQLICLRYHLNP